MELRVLRYFLAVAEARGYSAASERLHVTQPTLSRQIADLERELGVVLFERGKRGKRLALTEDGELLRRRAEEICLLADRTESEFRSETDPVHGTVSVGGGETRGMLLLAHAAADLRRDHPDVTLDVFSGNAEDVCAKLDAGLVDFGLLLGTEGPDRYERMALPAFDTWGLLMRADDPLADRRLVRPADVERLPLIVSRQTSGGGMLSTWLGRDLASCNIVGTYNLLYNASLMVEAKLGYAVCLDGIVATDGTSGFAFRPFSPTLRQNMHLVWKRGAKLSRAARAYLDAVKRMTWPDEN
ncbi:LysR family transcriptional regulator [Eggerthellaceae bacterium zg-887]|uniref:LysR family transcriptional regulator n=1 Tax=Xiamenia xianingshaonis TaxID=2682776 RepID=UPI00140BC8EE|nr:LysR family transcriptional regulator [Xiamenia xianingshaonis]NHM15104.1 LysR family transcriptional regulator [Xiamenia xianingshaonis]